MNDALALKGWLAIPGVQRGERTLAEQMLGLAPALAGCRGRSVLDLGCSEGLIGIEFAKAGATVRGYDLQSRFVWRGNEEADKAGVAESCHFYKYNLADLCGGRVPETFPANDGADIVLALAIVHKLRRPDRALANMARLARERLVLRLPIGSDGAMACKYDPQAVCDSRIVMRRAGFRLEQTCEGPRSEKVQHWVR